MSKNKFTKVMLDISRVEGIIQNWCEMNLEGDFDISIDENKQQIQYTIYNNSDEIKLIIYKAAGGVYTISPKAGKNPEISEIIADDIYNHLCTEFSKSPYSNGFSIKLAKEDFISLIELLKESGVTVENYNYSNEKGKANFEQYQLRSELHDSVVVKYFNNTNRVQVQGKPLYLFNEITSILCESEENAEAVVDEHIKICSLNINKNELNDEIESILGTSLYNYLNITQKALLSSALVLSKVEINGLDDYSYIIVPALKAFDGFFAKQLTDAGISLNKTKSDGKVRRRQFPEIFRVNADGLDCEMNIAYKTLINVNLVYIFQEMYNFYRESRNPYMHATEYDLTTSIVGNYQVAIDRLNEIFNTIKKFYLKISNI